MFNFLRKKGKKQASELIISKISQLMNNHFPEKSDFIIEQNKISEIVKEYREITTLIKDIDSDEKDSLNNITGDLDFLYFRRFEKINKPINLNRKNMSEIINGLNRLKHIISRNLENEKDVNHVLEGIKTETTHIIEWYLDNNSGNNISALLIPDLSRDWKILEKRIELLKKLTKNGSENDRIRISRLNDIIPALHYLIFEESRIEGPNLILYDKTQILEKLNLILELAEK